MKIEVVFFVNWMIINEKTMDSLYRICNITEVHITLRRSTSEKDTTSKLTDNMIVTSTSFQKHKVNLNRRFRKALESNYEIQLDEFQLFWRDVAFLDFKASPEGNWSTWRNSFQGSYNGGFNSQNSFISNTLPKSCCQTDELAILEYMI